MEFPAERTVYVRQDKEKFRMVTCTAVGEYPIKYEWKTYYDVSEIKLGIFSLPREFREPLRDGF